MKIQSYVGLFIVFALLVALVPAAQASGPAGNWASGISCQNLSGTTSANIDVYYYQEDNPNYVLWYDDPTPIPPNGFRGYYTPNVAGLPDGFLGSVVVSSNTDMACNVNTETTGAGTTGDPFRKGTSAGFNTAQVATKMYAPQVMKQFYGYGSYISVQNTSSAATQVTINYKNRAGAPVAGATETKTINGNTNHIFYQDDNTGLPANFVGSAEISSNLANLAVTVEFYADGTNYTKSQLHSYNGFSNGAQKLLIPRFVVDYYGYNSGLTIQNVHDSAATTVKITFYDALGNQYIFNSGSIPAGASLALYLPDVAELNGMALIPLQKSYGNAIVEAAPGGEIVAIVNEDNRGGISKGYVVPANRIGQGSTYNAFSDGDQKNSMFFPQITDKAGQKFSGGFQFSNTLNSNGTCNIQYTNNPQANQPNYPIPANGSVSIYAPNVPNLPDGFNSSVKVDCTVPIIGIANMAADPQLVTKYYGDSATTSNGLPK